VNWANKTKTKNKIIPQNSPGGWKRQNQPHHKNQNKEYKNQLVVTDCCPCGPSSLRIVQTKPE
jgi:hypothetical protein